MHTDYVAWFWGRVDKSAGPEGCWYFGAQRGPRYSRIPGPAGKKVRGHRVALALSLGVDLDKMGLALHRCDNRPCCNPSHLFEGTQADNMRDMSRKGRACYSGPGLNVARGSHSGHARLTEKQVVEMRRLYARGALQRELAQKYGVSQSVISEALRGLTWSHVKVRTRLA